MEVLTTLLSSTFSHGLFTFGRFFAKQKFRKQRPFSTNRTNGQIDSTLCGSRAGASSEYSRHPSSHLDTRPKYAQMPLVPFISTDERHLVCLVTVELRHDNQNKKKTTSFIRWSLVHGGYIFLSGSKLSQKFQLISSQ